MLTNEMNTSFLKHKNFFHGVSAFRDCVSFLYCAFIYVSLYWWLILCVVLLLVLHMYTINVFNTCSVSMCARVRNKFFFVCQLHTFFSVDNFFCFFSNSCMYWCMYLGDERAKMHNPCLVLLCLACSTWKIFKKFL